MTESTSIPTKLRPGGRLTIGKLAREANVHVETVRFYERRGLLKQPATRHGSFRVYPPEAVRQIRAIKRLQSLGFSLEDVENLLLNPLDEKVRCAGILERIEKKLNEEGERLEGLWVLKRYFQRYISASRGEAAVPALPSDILSILDAELESDRCAKSSGTPLRKSRMARGL